MKRPEGFDHNAAPEPDEPRARRAPRGRKSAQDTPPVDAPTAARAKRPAGTPADRAAPAPGSPTAPRQQASTSPSPDSTATAQASAERRRARKAARARRRFERAEVRRFTRRSRRRRATWVTVASILAALGVVLLVAVYSPILALREITIDGTSRVSVDDVRAAVDGQLGTPLALLDFGAIRSELAAFPLIRSYVTETVPPNTLRIHIVEREAIGTLKNNGSYDQVDPAGVVIASSADRPALPLIDVGGKGVDSAAFASAVEVLLAMPQAVLDQVDTITAKTADDVNLAIRGTSARVVWGSADESELKAQVLARMLERPECGSLAVVDVSAPLAPICGPE